MKRVLLFLSLGVTIAPASAQKSDDIILSSPHDHTGLQIRKPVSAGELQRAHNPEVFNKTTGGVHTGWYSYMDAMFSSTTKVWLAPIYNDSTIKVVVAGTAPSFWWLHGLGVSFDPVSPYFSNNARDLSGVPNMSLFNNHAYTVDSVSILGYYGRKAYNNYVDTLFIDVLRTSAIATDGAYSLVYAKDPAWYTDLGSVDSTLRFTTAIYNAAQNKISDSVYQAFPLGKITRITKILNAAAFSDSIPQSFHKWTFPVNIVVPAGEKVIAYAHFKSGHTYTLGTNMDSVNIWWQATAEHNGQDQFPSQMSGFQGGLMATKDERYRKSVTNYAGHDVLPSTYEFDKDLPYEDPIIDFFVKCTNCEALNIENPTALTAGDVYPNPSNTEVTIPFIMNKTGLATVSLTNYVGQKVSSEMVLTASTGQHKVVFTTADMAAGLYFYTIEANGERVTGKVIVIH